MSDVTYRDATLDDIPDIVALVESAYRGDASRVGWTTEADILDGQRTDPDGVRDVIVSSAAKMMLVDHDGELVACCQLEQRGETAYFGMFSVSPKSQGTGLGKKVMAAAERFVTAEWGAKVMEMTVISVRDDLVAWYERRGYRRTGEMVPFPYGDERFGIPLRDDLEFERLVKDLG